MVQASGLNQNLIHMQINNLLNKKILILGFGREGKSSMIFLLKNNISNNLAVADVKEFKTLTAEEKKLLKTNKQINYYGGKNYLQKIFDFEIVVKTPGINLEKIILKKISRKKIILASNLNIFLSNCRGKVIGVTGSKGKGTTATLLYKILKSSGKKAYLIGNIGEPFLDYLKFDGRKTIYVAELSSFQLESMNLKNVIDMGLFLSFFPEHLKEHGTAKNYLVAKTNIINGLKENGVLIYEQSLRKLLKKYLRNNIRKIIYKKGKSVKSRLLGEHNQQNIQAALTAAKLLGVKDARALKVIKNFKGLPYRMEFVGKFNSINFYCDALGTTPEATMAAIRGLKELNLKTLIVGGSSKGASLAQFKNLAREIVKNKISTLVALPSEGYKIADLVSKIKKNNPWRIIKIKNMRQAVQSAFKYSKPKETVLLSPAAASFDQYRDYAAKGDDFKRLVKKLK